MILFDYLSFTTTKVKAEEIIDEFLGVDSVEWVTSYKKARGYPVKYYFDGINVFFNNPQNEDMVWVEMCGKGCRAFDKHSSLDWYRFLKKVLTVAHNITRLDVAFDDRKGLLDMMTIFHETYKGNWVGRFGAYKSLISDKGATVEIGSPSSDIMFTIYDKAAEQAHKAETQEQKEELLSQHWVRFEMQFRDELAREFVKKFMTCPVGELFAGVLNNYLRFVTPSKTDSKKERWETRKWWTKFVNSGEKIELWSKCDENYNLAKCKRFVYNQCGNAIATLISIEGIEKFQKELRENKPPAVHEKYSSLIAEYGTRVEKPVPPPPSAALRFSPVVAEPHEQPHQKPRRPRKPISAEKKAEIRRREDALQRFGVAPVEMITENGRKIVIREGIPANPIYHKWREHQDKIERAPPLKGKIHVQQSSP